MLRQLALLVLVVLAGAAVSGQVPLARAAEPPFHELWRADRSTGFGGWTLHGVQVVDGRLALALDGSPVGGSEFEGLALPDGLAGVAVSPVRTPSASFRELIPSWNAETPPGTWVDVRVRAQHGAGASGGWTRWYEFGSWSTDSGAERRQSVTGQRDEHGRVSTDTLILAQPAVAYQVALLLHAGDAPDDGGMPATRTPTVSLVAALASTPSETARTSSEGRAAWGVTVPVPERSQMIYPNGGPVWCSPTSTSMVMAYWAEQLGEPALNRPVPEVAAAVYDTVYRGNGNWPFNTAYAARHGLVAYVSRMSALAQVERWIEVGVPVVASLAWEPGELPNAAVPSTDGHLLVIVGFTAAGDVVVNDPAADPRLGLSVRRVYPRATFERLWLTHSGGTVYLIYPESQQIPAADMAFGAW